MPKDTQALNHITCDCHKKNISKREAIKYNVIDFKEKYYISYREAPYPSNIVDSWVS